MKAIEPVVLVIFAVSVILQVIGLSLLPMTQGFTIIAPSVGVVVAFGIAMGLLARVSHSGVDLSVLIPWLAAVTPIVMIAVGIIVYRESASPLKISLLVGACIIIGFASKMA